MPDAAPSSSPKAVFLSYTSDDVAVASAVCEALRESGIEVWIDRSELQGGDAWDANIQRQIRECALIIPIISKRTQARREGYFRLEWRLADERMRLVADGTPLILPVAADETREQDALVPKSFLTVQWSRLPHGHVPPAFVARVKKLLGQESPDVSKTVPASGMLPTATGDSLAALDAPADEEPKSTAGSGYISSRRSWRPFAVALLGVLVGGIAIWFLKPAPKIEPPSGSKPLVRFAHELPPSVSFRNTGRPVIALSPDGRSFVYNTTAGLVLRKMDETEARVIPGTEATLTSNPTFSPDSQSLVFFSGSDLRRISVNGGASAAIAPAPDIFGMSWGSDGTILYGQADGIWRVAAAGGVPERVIPAVEGESLAAPQFLPDGKSILFTAQKGASGFEVEVGSLMGGERKVVVPGGYFARYLPATGHLLYVVDGELFGIAFDPDRRRTLGVGVPLVQGVSSVGTLANFALSEDGTLLYLVGRPALTVPVWVDRQGKEVPLKMEPAQYGSFALSPDASKVAIGVRSSPTAVGLVVWDFAGETRMRLTLGDRGGSIPVWSPDGSRIIYDSQDGRISAKPVNNTRPPEVMVERIQGQPGRISPYAITPDGRSVLFSGSSVAANSDIGMAPLDAKGEIKWLLNAKGSIETGPALSPDGKWMAYSSNESGRSEVYVSPFPNVDEDRVLISNAGGDRPLWSHDGKELFYVGGITPPTRRFMAATVSAEGDKFRVVSRSPLLDGTNENLHFVTNGGITVVRPIGPSPDGQRFLVLKEFNASTDRAPERIFIVQNWTEELKRRVPGFLP